MSRSRLLRALPVLAALAALVFEVALVWFIMPLPGSQRVRSVAIAYALHQWRWVIRGLLALAWGAGLRPAWRAGVRWRVATAGLSLVAAGVTYLTTQRMAADRIFRQPTTVQMASLAANTIGDDRLVTGIVVEGEARAYPLQAIGYHHQVRDVVAGRPVLVTYCTVCRTGRAFVPVVDGAEETFRLVGMDQFNAMLEDHRTGSWWRQANGEAVTGPRRGVVLEEIPSRQMTLGQWRRLYPETRVMQLDPAFLDRYPRDAAYERGTSRSALTGTDPRPWQEKSWVVGLRVGNAARAYDWGQLLREGALHDTLGGQPVVVVVAADSASFAAFVRPDAAVRVRMVGDSLVSEAGRWGLDGRGTAAPLAPLPASQEFWHSWRTFQPKTTRYGIGAREAGPALAR